MKKLLSTGYTDWAFNIAMLVLRAGLGLMMLPHGYDKLVHFAAKKNTFMNFLGMGSTVSLSLSLFAEFFCAIFVIIGLFTRFTVIPLIIGMSVALFKAHDAAIFGAGEKAALYLTGFLVILLVGPGKASADGMMGK
ncbi:DoxX family protein [Agriterribacter sp.]|uniref:DoxX family protein n=1 Tax=Agriterribacter sp. TaxID=2821509 RepID=UPI002BD431C9|nr:DoxX family protein [Agriterribacter sp.]HRO48408.1 DoxX family protein [Agriterribacter sp.]HRQ19300.1 DoxX family protein [Agriterribacter sp.]